MMSQASVTHARHGRDASKYKWIETVEDAMSKVGKQVGEELKKASRPASSRWSLVVGRWSLSLVVSR
jgi:hypothetical protein